MAGQFSDCLGQFSLPTVAAWPSGRPAHRPADQQQYQAVFTDGDMAAWPATESEAASATTAAAPLSTGLLAPSVPPETETPLPTAASETETLLPTAASETETLLAAATPETESRPSVAVTKTESLLPETSRSAPSLVSESDVRSMQPAADQSSSFSSSLEVSGSLEELSCKFAPNQPEENRTQNRIESRTEVAGNVFAKSPSPPLECCRSPVVDELHRAQGESRQSVPETESSAAVPDISCQLSEPTHQCSSERMLSHDRRELKPQAVQEPRTSAGLPDAPHISKPDDVLEKKHRWEESQKPASPRRTSQSSGSSGRPQSSGSSGRPQSSEQSAGRTRRTPPPSTFGSWKARHPAGVPAAGRPSATAVGRSVEAALDRLLAESGRTDCSTQVTQRTEHGPNSTAAGRLVSHGPRPAVSRRGGSPPRHKAAVSREGTPTPRQGTSASRQRTSVLRQGAPAAKEVTPARQVTTSSRADPASHITSQRTSAERSRTAEPSGRSETRQEERRHGGPRTAIGNKEKEASHTYGTGRVQTKISSHRDKADSRNSAKHRGSHTDDSKSKSRTKPVPLTERVQNSRLIISHRLNASSPHFHTEMHWNETDTRKARRGRPPTGELQHRSAAVLMYQLSLTSFNSHQPL